MRLEAASGDAIVWVFPSRGDVAPRARGRDRLGQENRGNGVQGKVGHGYVAKGEIALRDAMDGAGWQGVGV